MTNNTAPKIKTNVIFGVLVALGYFTNVNIYKLPSGYSRRLFVSSTNQNQLKILLNN